MRLRERRILRLEQARLVGIPPEPWAVFISTHLHGTPEAAADEQVFRQAHPGMPVLVCATVDASRPESCPLTHPWGASIAAKDPVPSY